MLEVGKLYKCDYWCFIVYPKRIIGSLETIPDVIHPSAPLKAIVLAASKRFNAEIQFIDIKVPFLILTLGDGCCEVLFKEHKGWIFVKDWMKIEKVAEQEDIKY